MWAAAGIIPVDEICSCVWADSYSALPTPNKASQCPPNTGQDFPILPRPSQVCASGLKAVMLAEQSIRTGGKGGERGRNGGSREAAGVYMAAGGHRNCLPHSITPSPEYRYVTTLLLKISMHFCTSGQNEIVVAGGMESMSNVPHFLPRWVWGEPS